MCGVLRGCLRGARVMRVPVCTIVHACVPEFISCVKPTTVVMKYASSSVSAFALTQTARKLTRHTRHTNTHAYLVSAGFLNLLRASEGNTRLLGEVLKEKRRGVGGVCV